MTDKPKIYHFDPSEERGYYICSEGYKCTVGEFVALTEYRELDKRIAELEASQRASVNVIERLQAENAELRADAEQYW